MPLVVLLLCAAAAIQEQEFYNKENEFMDTDNIAICDLNVCLIL